MPTGRSGTSHLAWGTTFAVVVQSLSHIHLFRTRWTAAHQASLSFTISSSFLKLLSSLNSFLKLMGACSVAPFPSCPQSLPASESFPMSPFFASGGQGIGASASTSVLPIIIQGCFPLGLTSLSSLLSKGLSRIFPRTTVWKHQFSSTQTFLWSSSHMCTHVYWKNHRFDYTDLSWQSNVSAF